MRGQQHIPQLSDGWLPEWARANTCACSCLQAPPAKRQARPSRAAKNAAAAAFVAMAADAAEEEGSDTDMGEASSDEEPSARRRRSGRARGGGSKAGQHWGSPSPAPSVSQKARPAAQKQQVAVAGEPQQQQPASSCDTEQPRRAAAAAAAPALPRVRAISSTGHTCRGRVKQKSHKSADLVEAGSLRCGWGAGRGRAVQERWQPRSPVPALPHHLPALPPNTHCRAEKGWYNAGYIFPEGFQSRTLFRSRCACASGLAALAGLQL